MVKKPIKDHLSECDESSNRKVTMFIRNETKGMKDQMIWPP